MELISRAAAIFEEPAGLRFNGLAIAYSILGYAAGVVGLFSASIVVNLLATLLLAHAMTVAAYLIHECGHNLVFRSSRHNARLGRVMSWICGAAYSTYEDMRYKHFRHHVDVDDVVWFDYERFFAEHPTALRVTRALEWFYIPAHEIIMHFIMVFTSFIIPERRGQRRRNVTVILVRGALFATMAVISPKAALLYVAAYLLMVTVLRFMDSLQHDYGYNLTLYDVGKPPRKGDYAWEQEHTFSNPHSLESERLNWLTLNFGFHNAHHDDMSVPWYRLPARHREMYGDDANAVIPLKSQLKIFHEQRVHRIVGNHEGGEPFGREFLRAAQKGEAYGGNAASFLTSF